MENFWSMICGDCGNVDNEGKPFCYDLSLLKDPSSCINHVLVISFDVLVLTMLLFIMIFKSSLRPYWSPIRYSNMQLVSAITNGVLGILHLSLGVWILEEKLRKNHEVFPLSWWLEELFHGLTWLFVSLTISLQIKQLSRAWLWMFSVLVFFVSGILCALSISYAIGSKELSLRVALDVTSFPGAILLLLCTYQTCKCKDVEREIDDSLRAPLIGQFDETNPVSHVTPFANAGLLSKIWFWWLNTLMKTGQKKTLQDEDIPKLRESDRAEICYSSFLEQLNKQRQCESSYQSSVLWTIILCYRREVLVTGFFALFKVLALSSTPLLLNAFILVAEGNESFKYEGYVLAVSLFVIKIIESLSQRQWYFHTRLVGMKIRSLLNAAIYKKILRLSNSARLIHSGGEIMNYMIVDAYRIGEFPFWFHQTWTTILQLCIALVILFRTIGLATLASLAVIVLTVIGNYPLAKLQHKYQSKLMVAQDERLKASSEALVNMKVLKLYAWENHFKNVVDFLRNVELKMLYAVQVRRTYNVFLFWTSPMLVSTASFLACYFLDVPLHASNVFTFVATVRLVQEPITSIPDVIAVIIQAKVAFARIVNFLDAPELQSKNLKNECFDDNLKGSISIKSANFSWEGNASKPTLRNINLEVKHGQKVAICGEVGSGKSTLLATILGEVTKIKGIVRFLLLYKVLLSLVITTNIVFSHYVNFSVHFSCDINRCLIIYYELQVDVYGRFAYVSQTPWIQTGTIRENILFGSELDDERYQETLQMSSLKKDFELLPYGDLTEIGERGVNLSGGQKQRIQLARALYQNADIYLLDDPFSAVDAHTAKNLFNVMTSFLS